MVTKSKRFTFGYIAFFTMILVSILKHWLPGISIELVLGAAFPVATVILGDTFRESKK